MAKLARAHAAGAALSAALLFLAACGGGGGSTPTPTPASTVSITASNQSSVARATVNGGMALSNANGLQVTDRRTTQAIASTQSTGGSMQAIDTALTRALAQMLDQRRVAQSATSTRPLAVLQSPSPCALGGTSNVTLNDNDNNQTLSGGDAMTIAFAQCKDGTGATINGNMVFAIGSVSAVSTSQVQFSGSLAFQHVSVTTAQSVVTMNGSVTMSASVVGTSISVSMSIGSDGLTVVTSSGGQSDTIGYLPGMTVTVSDNGTSMSFSLNGSWSSNALGGQLSVVTNTAFTQGSTAAYPNAGQVVVTGANQSSLRITVLDATQVRLELDANGDGTYETSTTVTWTTLLTS